MYKMYRCMSVRMCVSSSTLSSCPTSERKLVTQCSTCRGTSRSGVCDTSCSHGPGKGVASFVLPGTARTRQVRGRDERGGRGGRSLPVDRVYY